MGAFYVLKSNKTALLALLLTISTTYTKSSYLSAAESNFLVGWISGVFIGSLIAESDNNCVKYKRPNQYLFNQGFSTGVDVAISTLLTAAIFRNNRLDTITSASMLFGKLFGYKLTLNN